MIRSLPLLLLLAAPVAAQDTIEADCIDAVQKLGGRADTDDKLDPVARVTAHFPAANDAILLAVAKLPAVGELKIDDASKCTEKGYAALKELPALQKLSLVKSGATDRAFAALAPHRHLQTLYVGEPRATDAALASLKGMKDLRLLDVSGCKFTDRGLAHLAALPSLEDANLSGSAVTDAGLMQLKPLEKLTEFRAVGSGVTAGGAQKAEAAMPKLRVRY